MNELQKNQEQEPEVFEQENPASETSMLLRTLDPAAALVRIEQIAALASRYETALQTILTAATNPEDWQIFGDGDKAKVCLSSAGAMRIAKNFPIQFNSVNHTKEQFADDLGAGYRYIFEGYATLDNRRVWAQGVYSTRDKFLGFVKGEWKAPEDINEGHIRMAAYHIFMGNAVKELLGLRAMPLSRYQFLMKRSGQDAKATGQHSYAGGSQGGKTPDEHDKQGRLANACIELANAGMFPIRQPDGKEWLLEAYGEAAAMSPLEFAKSICMELSSFTGKDGKRVEGLGAAALAGKRLDITLSTAEKLVEQL